MPPDPQIPPLSPLRVAVMTFGAVVLVAAILSFAVLSLKGGMGHDPFAPGEAVGQAITPIALVAAVAAYFVQRNRLAKKP